jgi:hypothetical protein
MDKQFGFWGELVGIIDNVSDKGKTRDGDPIATITVRFPFTGVNGKVYNKKVDVNLLGDSVDAVLDDERCAPERAILVELGPWFGRAWSWRGRLYCRDVYTALGVNLETPEEEEATE